MSYASKCQKSGRALLWSKRAHDMPPLSSAASTAGCRDAGPSVATTLVAAGRDAPRSASPASSPSVCCPSGEVDSVRLAAAPASEGGGAAMARAHASPAAVLQCAMGSGARCGRAAAACVASSQAKSAR